MDALRTAFDHPYVLIVAMLLSLPCFVFVASVIFPNPEEDAEHDRWTWIPVLLDQPAPSIIGMKIVAFFIVCGAFTITFYKIGGWLVSLF